MNREVVAPVRPLVLCPDVDDVGLVLGEAPGRAPVVVGDGAMPAAADIPAGHKVAVRAVAAGQPVRKHGEVIGVALTDIGPGDHVHLHNLGPAPDYAGEGAWPARSAWAPPVAPTRDHFLGYRRPDGRGATRNYIAIVPTVNCSATVARMVAQAAHREHAGVPGLDGVIALSHDLGCGMAEGTPGDGLLRRTLHGYAMHPNVMGAVVISLGCEINQPGNALADAADTTVTIQDVGGTAAAVRAALAQVAELVADIRTLRRAPVPLTELTIGLLCGDGDAWSGTTANPAVGVAADLLVAAGGRVVLGGIPQLHGAAHLLRRRAADSRVAARIDELLAWWREYASCDGAGPDVEPSWEDRAGGITTLREKSLAAVLKAGTAPVERVVRYADPVTRAGLTLMDTPGHDPVSATGMVAGGATLLASVTGTGSLFGSRPTPCVRVSTTTGLYQAMSGDIDFDGGRATTSRQHLTAGRLLFEAIVDTASGLPTKAEQLGFGTEEITPWRMGAVL
ncbi:galactarate dehydratase [Actinacidiphila yanglinensis]|uniref:Galactarate dehydratase n=1 Tax=Actinacidiphila yanglinensis TaxID=310779 RepID=A0A1H6EDN0_9ACTN|nr:altronate dehydratase family protein [Actinacidiphila yanglinensis]SEG94974.1 galactarate dehydratase [Actinacidiphila yanglinensis]